MTNIYANEIRWYNELTAEFYMELAMQEVTKYCLNGYINDKMNR